MIKAATLPADIDLSAFSRWLWQSGLPHRISEQTGQQILWVVDENSVEIARNALLAFERGDIQVDNVRDETLTTPSHAGLLRTLKLYPLTMLLIVICVIIGLLSGFGGYAQPVSWLTFTGFELVAGNPYFIPLSESLSQGEIWRILTPIFLHFSPLHLIFNMMWLFVLGGRIENNLSSSMLLILIVVIGVVSNATQFIFSLEHPLFGGFSGVVYGLLGFCWVYHRFVPESGLGIPGSIVGFMIGWLLICFTGVLEVIGFGAIANAAHTAGLLSGALIGLCIGLFSRIRTAKGQ